VGHFFLFLNLHGAFEWTCHFGPTNSSECSWGISNFRDNLDQGMRRKFYFIFQNHVLIVPLRPKQGITSVPCVRRFISISSFRGGRSLRIGRSCSRRRPCLCRQVSALHLVVSKSDDPSPFRTLITAPPPSTCHSNGSHLSRR